MTPDPKTLVERLKAHVRAHAEFETGANKWANENSTEWAIGQYEYGVRLIAEAAARIAKLEGALEPFARDADNPSWESSPDHNVFVINAMLSKYDLTIGDFRRAAAALNPSTPTDSKEPSP
jgi:hypothetical protein